MLNSERDALLSEARAQADQVLRSADNDARERIKDHYIARQAEAHGAEIITNAERDGLQVRRDADEYAFRVLRDLDQRLDGLLTTVRNGMETLERRQNPAVADEDHASVERGAGERGSSRWGEP